MKTGNCSKCYYCTLIEGRGDALTCVRYPPTAAAIPQQNQLTGDVNINVMLLPVQVVPDYWCGEFKEAPVGLHTVD